jgi:3-deoxy-7-phosphoheptulonate synthase
MSFTFLNELPSPAEIKKEYPLSPELTALKKERDHMIRNVIAGKDDRFLVIIGPCSADNEDSVCDYVSRLTCIQEKVKDKVIIIPRIYTNKPRTTGEGYMGLVHQPDPHKKADFQEGLHAVRKMHLRAIKETGLPAADEMLYPENFPYIDDLLSYVAVGARSVEDQQHRLTVSGMDVPVGMKNPTSGDFSVMLNSCVAAQIPHTFLYRQWEVDTPGNPLTHTILRGAVNKHGQCIANYHYEDLMRLLAMYQERPMLKNPAAIIDANHSNSNKKFNEQPRIVSEVLHSRHMNKDLEKMIKGVMVESYLVEGTQKLSEGTYGKSITDPCLGWEDTEKLLYTIADRV